MRHALFIALLFICSPVLYAQEGFKGEHFIEVTGTAESEIEPNEITVHIRLKEFEENRNKVQLEKLDQDFLNALKAAGIDRKRLALADIGSQLEKLGRRDKDAFREKTYQLVLTSGGELERFLAKLEPVQVDELAIVRVHHTDYEKIKLNLKIEALKTAKAKAEALLSSIGAGIGKPLMVREWDHEPVRPFEMNANIRLKSREIAEDAPPAVETEFRKIRLRVQLSAQFEIK